jgi:WD40-like Beta Propeller Repeat
MVGKNLLLATMLAGALPLFSAAQTVGPTPIGPVWEIQREKLGIRAGEGTALSPDGKAVAYMARREEKPFYAALLLTEIGTGRTTVLRPPDDFMMPGSPAFSPDGRSVVFQVQGPTWSYSTDIYVVGADGTGLKQLTKSEYRVNPPAYGEPGYSGAVYERYYGSPRFSPDASHILLSVFDEGQEGKEFTAVMKPDGSDLQVLAEGRPCCWSADGKAVYYTQPEGLTRMDLATRKTITVPRPPLENGQLIGRMKGKPWFAFYGDDGRIGWYDFDQTTPLGPQFVGEWSVPAVKMNGAEEMTLKGFDWSDGSEVLLWYQGDETERFEVVRIADPASLSR